MPRRRPPRLALAALGLAACFTGGALQGEPCASDADCGTELRCTADRLCGELRCPDSVHTLSLPSFAPQVTILVTYTASMAEALTDDPGTTRWQQVLAFVDALAQALGDRIDLGLQVVPTVGLMNEYQPCRTDARARILPAADQAGAILAALPAAPLNIGEHALRAGLDLSLAGFDLTDPDHLRPVQCRLHAHQRQLHQQLLPSQPQPNRLPHLRPRLLPERQRPVHRLRRRKWLPEPQQHRSRLQHLLPRILP